MGALTSDLLVGSVRFILNVIERRESTEYMTSVDDYQLKKILKTNIEELGEK